MLFNSFDFAFFLPIVFVLYWSMGKWLRIQNIVVLISSYVFYSWWDWRFTFLILFSTVLDFYLARIISSSNERIARLAMFASIAANLGLLGVFKYFNFFIESFNQTVHFFGGELSIESLSLILPVGISFYTFQTLSYTIDVYKRKIEPVNDIIQFGAFVSFFPQLVAGPIERASHLLPQFHEKRTFDYEKAVLGLRQILWGLFKKIVIADNCAVLVNNVFGDVSNASSLHLTYGAILFAFQIYCDFSGYSDIAIGSARLFGFDLMKNFNFPYFSRDLGEFWRRWHISLSTWFRDYLYIPLGGSRKGLTRTIVNVFIIFLVSGLWHGANWTFVFWGGINALFFIPSVILKSNRKNLDTVAESSMLPNLKEMLQMLFTFCVACVAWVFFRAESLTQAFHYFGKLGSDLRSFLRPVEYHDYIEITILIFLFLVIEWIGRKDEYAIEKSLIKLPCVFRWGFYIVLLFSMLWFYKDQQEFIYFQF